MMQRVQECEYEHMHFGSGNIEVFAAATRHVVCEPMALMLVFRISPVQKVTEKI
jgi:hypothetical protein